MNITFKFPQISSVIETIHGHIKNAKLLQKCWLARWISITLWHSCFHGDRNWARYSSLNCTSLYHQVMLLAYCFTYQSLSLFWAIISITNISYILPSFKQASLRHFDSSHKKKKTLRSVHNSQVPQVAEDWSLKYTTAKRNQNLSNRKSQTTLCLPAEIRLRVFSHYWVRGQHTCHCKDGLYKIWVILWIFKVIYNDYTGM